LAATWVCTVAAGFLETEVDKDGAVGPLRIDPVRCMVYTCECVREGVK
jgi:hypothetical protein